MESQAKSKYRDEHNAPLPGAAGDLARSCDEQLLDAFLAIKRIIDERDLLIERHSRESKREEPPEDAYDASTDDEDARLEDVEPPERENGPSGDVERQRVRATCRMTMLLRRLGMMVRLTPPSTVTTTMDLLRCWSMSNQNSGKGQR